MKKFLNMTAISLLVGFFSLSGFAFSQDPVEISSTGMASCNLNDGDEVLIFNHGSNEVLAVGIVQGSVVVAETTFEALFDSSYKGLARLFATTENKDCWVPLTYLQRRGQRDGLCNVDTSHFNPAPMFGVGIKNGARALTPWYELNNAPEVRNLHALQHGVPIPSGVRVTPFERIPRLMVEGPTELRFSSTVFVRLEEDGTIVMHLPRGIAGLADDGSRPSDWRK